MKKEQQGRNCNLNGFDVGVLSFVSLLWSHKAKKNPICSHYQNGF
jgi:hypothetical protein